jgi:hypothetical protein
MYRRGRRSTKTLIVTDQCARRLVRVAVLVRVAAFS